MRAVVQRVLDASVTVEGTVVGSIGPGLLVLLGIQRGDTDAEVAWMVGKIAGLRIFPDDAGAMNRDLATAGGAILVVSQFTLLGDARRGNRPSFVTAASPDEAMRACDAVVDGLRERGLAVATGRFRTHMQVRSTNDGPVTIILERAPVEEPTEGA